MTTLPLNAPPAFHLLAKPTGAVCNLDCTYCFFLSKEMLYPGSRFRMADEMLETYIRQLIEGHQVPQVNVAWQGGEPTLMGLDFFNRSIEYVEKYRKPGMSVEYTIQTNGTLIDDAWAAFFKTHNFLVGISIDGPRAMHDAYRVDKGGQPTFDKVMRGLSFLQKHGVEYNTLTTLHHANADHPAEVYRFLRDECGSRFHQFIPIIERVGEADAERADTPLRSAQPEPGQVGARQWTSWRDRPLYTQEGDYVTDRSVTAEQYGTFLIGVFEEWVRRDVGTSLRADVRRGPGQLVWRAVGAVRAFQDLWRGFGDRAQRRPLFVRPLRGAGLQAGQHHGNAHDRADRLAAAAQVRPGQVRHAAALLPGVRRAFCLPWRLPQGPFYRHA